MDQIDSDDGHTILVGRLAFAGRNEFVHAPESGICKGVEKALGSRIPAARQPFSILIVPNTVPSIFERKSSKLVKPL